MLWAFPAGLNDTFSGFSRCALTTGHLLCWASGLWGAGGGGGGLSVSWPEERRTPDKNPCTLNPNFQIIGLVGSGLTVEEQLNPALRCLRVCVCVYVLLKGLY